MDLVGQEPRLQMQLTAETAWPKMKPPNRGLEPALGNPLVQPRTVVGQAPQGKGS